MTDLRYVLSALYRAEESVDRAEKSNGRSGESIKRSGLSNGRSGVPIDDAEKSIDGKIAAGIREILKAELRALQAELEFLDPLPVTIESRVTVIAMGKQIMMGRQMFTTPDTTKTVMFPILITSFKMIRIV